MKNIYTLLLLATTLSTLAQAPATYYNNATGTGYTLKTQLKTIITNGHSDQGYGALWTLYNNQAFRDNFYEDNGTILDMYSENPNGTDSYEYNVISDQCGNYDSEGDCYNREHLVPQSYFENFQINPMKNDPFHVVPSDGWVNGQRNNLPFGPVGSATYTSSNGSKKGQNTNVGYSAGYAGVVFEPIDEFKGDIARSLLYFSTRYEDFMDNFYNAADASTTQAKAMFDGSTNKVFSDTFLSILLTWHQNDPVSAKEIAINNAVYNFQGNRNPYIDHPEYACQIWITACAALSTDSYVGNLEVAVYPNPSNDNNIRINSKKELTSIAVININGQTIRTEIAPSSHNNIYLIENLPSGFYFLRMESEAGSVTKKIVIN
ncbi:MAG TPA: endonuclease [Flavobacterium sp.]|nr:endonuclease [Flavobacterium sp.]